MPCKQFCNSIQSIARNRHINPVHGIAKHLQWQVRKVFNLFPFEQKISQSRIVANHRRCGVSALINSQGLYNYNNMNLVRSALEEGGVFFDVGANIGSYALIASEQEKVEVYAFEPHPTTFNFLKQNIDLNHRRNVQLFNIALGSADSEIFLTDDPGSATNYQLGKASEEAIRVKCRRVDSFCLDNQISPNMVKIDVEGFEEDVLTGFGEVLERVDLFLVEINGLSNVHSKGERELYDLFLKYNFLGPFYFDFDARVFSRDGSTNQEDSIFMSRRFARKSKWKVATS